MKQGVKKFFKSFNNAGKGVELGFEQRNMKVHGVIGVAVLMLGWYVNLSPNEWFIVLMLIAIVFMAELFNSSIEELADVVKKKNYCDYEETRATRDLAAGAVLVVAFMSAMVGLMIFLPKLI